VTFVIESVTYKCFDSVTGGGAQSIASAVAVLTDFFYRSSPFETLPRYGTARCYGAHGVAALQITPLTPLAYAVENDDMW